MLENEQIKFQALRVTKLNEAGFKEAMTGLSIYYSDEEYSMVEVANMEASNPDGDHSFLGHMVVWVILEAPLYFIQSLSVLPKRAHLMSTMTRIENTYSDELAHITDKTPMVMGKMGMYKLMTSFTYDDLYTFRKSGVIGINWKRLVMQLARQVKYPEFLALEKATDECTT